MTAEGVEDEEMAKVMTEVGVDYLQGYCFSKPIPMEDFVEYVNSKDSKLIKWEGK